MAKRRIPRPDSLESPSLAEYAQPQVIDLAENKAFAERSTYDGKPHTHQWFRNRQARGIFKRRTGAPATMPQPPTTFMFSRTYGGTESEDEEWIPIRMIGEGGWGKVGYWQKRKQNIIVDELAIKQEQRRGEVGSKDFNLEFTEIDHLDRPGLTREAVIQQDINQFETGAAVHLRNFKYLKTNPRQYYRYYLIFCPHGSLASLRARYRAWNQYFPELFLWHTFHNLTKACWAMREPLKAKPEHAAAWYARGDIRRDRPPNKTVLSFVNSDIKPDNILLDYPSTTADPANPDADYPVPLMADFGRIFCTGFDDPGNPWEILEDGTVYYYAPEQEGYGISWPVPPTGTSRYRTGARKEGGPETIGYRDFLHSFNDSYACWKGLGYVDDEEWYSDYIETRDGPVSHAMNIHGIGRTMFELVTLAPAERLLKTRAHSWEQFQANGNHQIEMVRTRIPHVYTPRLRKLVHRCIDPNPDNRPTQTELYHETMIGLRQARKRAIRARRTQAGSQAAGGPHPDKLYFVDNEINNMPIGKADFRHLSHEWRWIVVDRFLNPDIPELRMPPPKGNIVKTRAGLGDKRLLTDKYAHDNVFLPWKLGSAVTDPDSGWDQEISDSTDDSASEDENGE